MRIKSDVRLDTDAVTGKCKHCGHTLYPNEYGWIHATTQVYANCVVNFPEQSRASNIRLIELNSDRSALPISPSNFGRRP